jgi:hypothetical protein
MKHEVPFVRFAQLSDEWGDWTTVELDMTPTGCVELDHADLDQVNQCIELAGPGASFKTFGGVLVSATVVNESAEDLATSMWAIGMGALAEQEPAVAMAFYYRHVGGNAGRWRRIKDAMTRMISRQA